MTIASTLKVHGHNVLTQILPNGRLVLKAGTVGLGSSAGAIAVKPHAFHGGAAIEDAVLGSALREQESLLAHDRVLMAAHFPQFAEFTAEGALPTWTGTIDTGFGIFVVSISRRRDGGLPRAIPEKSKGRRGRNGIHEVSPHLYLNGDICFADPKDWDAAHHEITDVVAWVAHWHAVYVEWVFTGVWAAEGVA